MIVRGIQRARETVTAPPGGEHYLRRPSTELPAAGPDIEQVEWCQLGLVESFVACIPR